MIIRKLKNIYSHFIVRYLSNQSEFEMRDWIIGDNIGFEAFCNCIDKTIDYNVSTICLARSNEKHKWVGAQFYHGKVYAIPNDETHILFYDSEIHYIAGIKEGSFKWTGGCVWNNAVYCFPRTASSFLRIDENGAREIPLTAKYEHEHHYSGVCTNGGIVYQPPRNTNHILKTDLKTGISTKIDIINKIYHVSFRYCGSIIHPNGFVYFFPENNNQVIKLDIKTDKWCFIGKKISTMCFDAKIGLDGNIYGYSAYCNGIMKIDIKNDTVQMIHEEINSGAYGTKYGVDGCLYSVPGNGDTIYKYDVESDKLEAAFDLNDKSKAKYAGGITLPNGQIIYIPAQEKSMFILSPNKKIEIPEAAYNLFCVDNY